MHQSNDSHFLVAENLTKFYGGKLALRGLTFFPQVDNPVLNFDGDSGSHLQDIFFQLAMMKSSQETAPGVAQDWAEAISLFANFQTKTGNNDCLITQESSKIQLAHYEHEK